MDLLVGKQVYLGSLDQLHIHLCTKAELLLLKLIHLFAREVLLLKKLEREDTKEPSI